MKYSEKDRKLARALLGTSMFDNFTPPTRITLGRESSTLILVFWIVVGLGLVYAVSVG